MRILHVVPSYIPAYRYGGPIQSVHGLCKSLAKLGHDVHVFTTNVDGPFDSRVPLGIPVDLDGVKVWYFPSRNLRRLYWSPPMARALKKHIYEFDLVHLHSIYLWPTWAAAHVARKAQLPYVLSPRGMLVRELIQRKSRWIKRGWIRLIERNNIQRAAGVHFTSEVEVEEALAFRNIRFPHFFVIPNGIDMEDAEEQNTEISSAILEVAQRTPYLFFLGRINWKKGLDRLLSALAHVPDVSLVIAGNDEENYRPILEDLAGKYKVKHRIVFVGPVYGKDKAALLRHASVLVLPSYSENFGIVVLEAMAVGLPVVVTPEVGLSETVEETGAGLVVEGDPDKLGNSIRSLLADPERMKEMGTAGKKTAVARFSWDAVARQMEKAYQDILNQGGCPHAL